MSYPDKADIDHICTTGTLFGESPHITMGPDAGTEYDPSKLSRGADGFQHYNGHPISDSSCSRHNKRLAISTGHFAARKYRRGVPGAGGEPS